MNANTQQAMGHDIAAKVRKVLMFGYGNPSRGDDAVGPLLLDRLQSEPSEQVEYLTDFQLQVEHALDLQQRDLVLFADASISSSAPFGFTRLSPLRDHSYTTHAMHPASVLLVYQEIFGHAPPPAFLLSIRGERFELGEALSSAASENLAAALDFARSLFFRAELSFWVAQSKP